MSTFVLVPGFWLGSWAWRDVTEVLRADGHYVYPISLTGLGERAHLAGPETDLDTHITDIVNLLHYEDLSDVILVGHSYGGLPVTGAADRVPERLSRVMYLDSGPMPAGMAQHDANDPETRSFIDTAVKEQGEGYLYPMPSWEDVETRMGASTAGLGEEERHRFRSLAVAHPAGTFTQPLHRNRAASPELPKTLIACSFPLDQVREMIASGHPFFAELAGPEWDMRELPTGHWPMFSRPGETARLLAAAAT